MCFEDLESMAWDLGAVVVYGGVHTAFCCMHPEGPIIGLPEDAAGHQKAFLLAHELGHQAGWKPRILQEIGANHWAKQSLACSHLTTLAGYPSHHRRPIMASKKIDPFDRRTSPKPRSLKCARALGEVSITVFKQITLAEHAEIHMDAADEAGLIKLGQKIGERMFREKSPWTINQFITYLGKVAGVA
jgi:hypothetical protein